ncbi:hypothetical protein F1880_000830, partial [Penicillium rolfsii]
VGQQLSYSDSIQALAHGKIATSEVQSTDDVRLNTADFARSELPHIQTVEIQSLDNTGLSVSHRETTERTKVPVHPRLLVTTNFTEPELLTTCSATEKTMPPANSATSTRITDSMLGMSPGEVRLLLLGHLSSDKKTGKVNIDKLAIRAGITVPSARNMYRAALSKLAKLNPDPSPDEGDDTGHSTGATSPSATPSRHGGRPRGRPPKNKVANAATSADATTTASKDECKSDNRTKVEESEVEMKDDAEETGIIEGDV